jgi:hypothetical protein
MRRHKYLLGALMGVIGALAFSSVAWSDPIGETLQTTFAPKKQDKKTFGGVSMHLHHQHLYDSFVTSHGPRQMAYTLPRDVKFVPGSLPVCQLSQVEHKLDSEARAACPKSIIGQGSLETKSISGALESTITFFRGEPSANQDILAHIVVEHDLLVLDVIGDISGRTLTWINNPNTPGTVLTTIDVTFNKRRTGKSTFFLMARCGKKRTWSMTETTTFYSDESLSAASTQKCKQKRAKQ